MTNKNGELIQPKTWKVQESKQYLTNDTYENDEFTNDKWNLSSKNVHKYTQMMISPPPPPTTTTTPTPTH